VLRDIERKVLRILWNFSLSHAGSMPYCSELRTKTGKRENEIKFILNKLKEQNFIEWDGQDTDTIKIIRGWEDEPAPMPTHRTDNIYL
jgi:predicted transcriptional regulator